MKKTTIIRDEFVVKCRKLNSIEYFPVHCTDTNKSKEDALNRFNEYLKIFGRDNDLIDVSDYYVAHRQVTTITSDWKKV